MNFLLSATLIAAITLLLHGSAMDGHWRADDGNHLLFALEFSPWQYIFVPSVMAVQSWANLTPWNALFYDVNLAVFGFSPAGQYGVQIGLIGLTGIATYDLLAVWLKKRYAVVGAVLFLLGLPTFYVGQYLMTGHYVFGLLCIVLSLRSHAAGVAGGQVRWFILGAGFYLLAVLSKEVYVPLPTMLPFLFPSPWRVALRRLVPYLAILVGYLVLRYVVLGSLLGGYAGIDLGVAQRLSQFLAIPGMLLGSSAFGYVGLFAGLLLMGIWVRSGCPLTSLLFAVFLVLAPLYPLTSYPGIQQPDRYLYLVWWGGSISIAFALNAAVIRVGHRFASAMFLIFLVGLFFGQRSYQHMLGEELVRQDALYRAALGLRSMQYLQVSGEGDIGYQHGVLSNVVEARSRWYRQASAGHVLNPAYDASRLPFDANVLGYDPVCACVRDTQAQGVLRDGYERVRQTYRPGMPINVHVRYAAGRIGWEFGPYDEGIYRVVDAENRVYHSGRSGSYPWSQYRSLRFRVEYLDPQGWRVSTPEFQLNPDSQPGIDWRGNSIEALW